jgi:hypothetical protein
MKQSVDAYTSVGIEASSFADSMHQGVSQELFSIHSVFNDTVISQDHYYIIANKVSTEGLHV